MLKELRHLQSALYAESKRALLIVLQGRDASGKDGTVGHVCSAFNQQGCTVASFKQPSAVELAHDYLWRVHQKVPARGIVGVFNRSQYEDVLAVRVHRLAPRAVWIKRYAQINAFEQMLVANGTVILKFFLHISKAEQRKRLLERVKDPAKNWKVSASDLADRQKWGEYTVAYQDVLSRCSTPWAPWYLVPADDKAARNYLVSGVILATLKRMAPQFPRGNARILAKYRRELSA
jgi:PPK2 family polyphosphate:nucleotide phosphotransferase